MDKIEQQKQKNDPGIRQLAADIEALSANIDGKEVPTHERQKGSALLSALRALIHGAHQMRRLFFFEWWNLALFFTVACRTSVTRVPLDSTI
jgi:hypothetical protein